MRCRMRRVVVSALFAAATVAAAPAHANVSFDYPLAAPFAGEAAPKSATPQVQIGPAYVYTHKHQEFVDGWCSGGTGGYIRFAAIRGVTSLTVVFNDGAYGGAEQRVSAYADEEGNWTQDHPEGSDDYPDLIPPKGEHQIGWTGGAYFGPGECQPDNTDYSTRMTNAHTEYYREGEYIDGQVIGPCADGECPPAKGVKVTAKGPGGGSDTTTASGRYSIKVKKGTYTVVPNKGDLRFDPKSKKVSVGTNKTGRADFTVGGGPAKLDVEVVPKQTPINVSDSPEQDGPAQTTVDVTVRNTGEDTAAGVTLEDLGIVWDVDDVKAPDPLPLKQVGPPSAAELGDIAPGDSATSQFLVEATGDGTYKLIATAKGTDSTGKAIKGEGKAKIQSQSPLLFIYTRPEQSVPSPDAPELIKAGTALSMRVRLWNRSYKETLAVYPMTVQLEGNLLGGYLQKADLPIQGPDKLDDLELVYKANNVIVLQPRESPPARCRLQDELQRPELLRRFDRDDLGGRDPGRRDFVKPKTNIFDPKTAKAHAGRARGRGVRRGLRAPRVLDRRPAARRAAVQRLDRHPRGVRRVHEGGAHRGRLFGHRHDQEHSRPAETGRDGRPGLRPAARRARGGALDGGQGEQGRSRGLRPLRPEADRVHAARLRGGGEGPGGAQERPRGVRQVIPAPPGRAREPMGRGQLGRGCGAARHGHGQIAGDVGLGDVIPGEGTRRAPAHQQGRQGRREVPRRRAHKLAPTVERFTAKAQPAVRAMKFLATKLKPGFVPDYEALQVLYGLSRTQSKFLQSLARAQGILIAVRSRGRARSSGSSDSRRGSSRSGSRSRTSTSTTSSSSTTSSPISTAWSSTRTCRTSSSSATASMRRASPTRRFAGRCSSA